MTTIIFVATFVGMVAAVWGRDIITAAESVITSDYTKWALRAIYGLVIGLMMVIILAPVGEFLAFLGFFIGFILGITLLINKMMGWIFKRVWKGIKYLWRLLPKKVRFVLVVALVVIAVVLVIAII